MAHEDFPVFSGRIGSNQEASGLPEGGLPHVVLSRTGMLQYAASLTIGTRAGVPGATRLTPQAEGFVWIPESQLHDPLRGHAVGSWVENALYVSIVRPTSGEPFSLPSEVLDAVDRLAEQHSITWEYVPQDDFAVAAVAMVAPADHRLEIAGQQGIETFEVSAQHIIAGGLRAAMAFEFDRLRQLASFTYLT